MSYGEEFLNKVLEKVSNLSPEDYLAVFEKAKRLKEKDENSFASSSYFFSSIFFSESILSSWQTFFDSNTQNLSDKIFIQKPIKLKQEATFPANEDLDNAA
ncbi:hypothetical protein EOM81_11620 [bacterium]|nr:hypothetical protein [bacterium]